MAANSKQQKPLLHALTNAVLLTAAVFFFFCHYQSALQTWFLREDSRFFATSIFSLYDLWSVFTEPMNSMGQYRPVTKVLWAAPRWFGFFDPVLYHLISLLIIGGAAVFLGRISWLYFRNLPLAVVTGFIFSLTTSFGMPAHWLSAWHNSALSLFFFAAVCLRLEAWRRDKHSGAFRAASLLALFLAIASREVAFVLAAALVLLDFQEKRSLRHSLDLVVLVSGFAAFLFLFSSPLEKAGVRLQLASVLAPSAFFAFIWDAVNGIFWASKETPDDTYPWLAQGLSFLLLSVMLLGFRLHRAIALGGALFFLGIFPFFLISRFNLEYATVSAGGGVLALSSLAAVLLDKRPSWRFSLSVLLAFAAVLSYYQHRHHLRDSFHRQYVEPSRQLKRFVLELSAFSQTLPPHRRILIESFGPYKESQAADSHHFLSPGLDELLPHHYYQFSSSALGIEEGTGMKDPAQSVWTRIFSSLPPPLEIRYTPSGFEAAGD